MQCIRAVLSVLQEFQQPQDQQMQGIESVVAILQPFAPGTLVAPVEPYGHQRQQRKALLGQKMGLAQNLNFVAEAPQHRAVDVPQTEQLPEEAPPLPAPEEIEHQHSENTGMIVVRKGDEATDIAQTHRGAAHQNPHPQLLFPHFFVPMDHPDGHEKGP